MKKCCVWLLTLLLIFTVCPVVLAEESPQEIVVLYTNDVHCQIETENGAGYAEVAAYKKQLQNELGENNVLLVDAGDAVQGQVFGMLSEGKSIIEIMNTAGYDLATFGNHEFDYGMDQLNKLTQMAEFPYISCNFVKIPENESVFPAYYMFDCNGVKIAFVGITTPESLTKSTPIYFQDDAGNYVYGFCQDQTGTILYETVQKAVDEARAAGAQYVVALAHLGDAGITQAWTSEAVIANTSGIDAMIDGHSHEQYVRSIKNKEGKEILLTQTGTKFQSFGKLTLNLQTGTFAAETVSGYPTKDDGVTAQMQRLEEEYGALLEEIIGRSEVDLISQDKETGEEIVRRSETNLGDFCADAYRISTGADVAILNGGGIRSSIEKGEVTYGDLLNVQPFGNSICVVEVTGQQILDALEMGVKKYPEFSGGFLQVSGITFTLDDSIASSVKTDENGAFLEVSGERRVKNVKIQGEDLELDKKYTLASHEYLIKNGGDGYTMFQNCTVVQDGAVLDSQCLVTYISTTLNGIIGKEYENISGSGRIVLGTGEETGSGTVYIVDFGDTLWSIASEYLGSGTRWKEVYDANRDRIGDPNFIYEGMELKIPA